MQYPEMFKQKVLSVYDNSEQIKNLLESGSSLIGDFLNVTRHSGIPGKEIVDYIQSGNSQELLQRAQKFVVVEDLYSEWCQLAYPSKTDDGKQI